MAKLVEDALKLIDNDEFANAIECLQKYLVTEPASNIILYEKLRSVQHDLTTKKPKALIKADILYVLGQLDYKEARGIDKFRHLFLSLLAYSLLPLMPLIASGVKGNVVNREDIIVSLALFCVSVSLSLQKSTERLIGIILSLLPFMVATNNNEDYGLLCSVSISIITFTLLVNDRIQRHWFKQEKFI